MLDDRNIMGAVAKIAQRSERQTDLAKLQGTFVDIGLLPQLQNKNNQILYGRRGTGKTHALKVLQVEIERAGRNIVVYLDARTLGSSAQFTDEALPIQRRCLALFRDILTPIYNALVEYLVANPTSTSIEAWEAADGLVAVFTEPNTNYVTETFSTSKRH